MRSSALLVMVAVMVGFGCTDPADGNDAGGADAGEHHGGEAGPAGDAGDASDEAGSNVDASSDAAGDGDSGQAASDAGSDAASGEAAGLVNFDTFAFYGPVLVASPDGVLHLFFHLNTSPSELHYARCTDNCGVGSQWTVAIIATGEFLGSTRVVVGADSRLHALYEIGTMGSPRQLIYASCGSSCSEPASWSKTNLESLFGGGWNSPSYGAPLVIDAQNRLYFTVDRSIYLDGGLTMATCATGCANVGNWTAGKIGGATVRTSLAVLGTTLHQLVDNSTNSGQTSSLSYRTCAANCTAEASWQTLPNMFAYDGTRAVAIAVTAQGGIRVVYNQGVSAADESPTVKAQDGRLLFWGCDSACLEKGSWSGLIMGAVDDGDEGLAMAELGGGLVLAISNGDRVYTRVCEQNCLLESSWQEGDVDTITALGTDYDPYAYVGATCSGQAPLSASWKLEDGVVAILPNGTAAFAHTTSILRVCQGSTSVVYLPGFGRVVYLP